MLRWQRKSADEEVDRRIHSVIQPKNAFFSRNNTVLSFLFISFLNSRCRYDKPKRSNHAENPHGEAEKRVPSKHGRLHVLKKSIQKAYVVEARPHAMTTNSTRLVALASTGLKGWPSSVVKLSWSCFMT